MMAGGVPAQDISRLAQPSASRARVWSNARRGAPLRIPKHLPSAALTDAGLQPDHSAEHQADELNVSVGRFATRLPHSAPSERVADMASLDQLVTSTLHPQAPVWAGHVQRRPQPSQNDDCYKVGNLAKNKNFEEALALLQQMAAAPDHGPLCRVSQRYFMRYAGSHKAARHALSFLKVVPTTIHTINTYNLALDACAASKDTETATHVVDLCIQNNFTPDTKLFTTYMKVFMNVGAVDRAYAVYNDMKRRSLPLDAQVVGTLIHAFAQAMVYGNEAAHERKNKLVLMERAMNVFQEAEEQGVRLNITCWNSLIVCAGRCGQLKRAFEMLDSIQQQGLRTDAYTYGALMEACIQEGRPQLAHRLFDQALMEGHTSHVELYTLATTACRTPNAVDWQQAMRIFNTMQRHAVPPDEVYYSALIAVAGHAGHVGYAFELLTDMVSEGLRLSSVVCSSLIYACLRQQQIGVARKVYNLCATHGCYPSVSQYNRLMDVYASARRFGDVVSLLSDMTQLAGHQPNLNTYRILINACQQTDQAALAFEVFAVMKANRVPILSEKFAITMYHALLKCCLNMLRHIWAAHNPHPAPWASRTSRPVLRLAEARQVLLALGSSLEARGASSLLLQDPSASMWTQYALSTYRDMLARGWKPTAQVLDKLMGCFRIPSSMALQHAIASGRRLDSHNLSNLATTNTTGTPPGVASHTPHTPNGTNGTNGQGLSPFSWASHLQGSATNTPHMNGSDQGLNGMTDLRMHQGLPSTMGQPLTPVQPDKYQLVFERRALGVIEDAIARGFLPAFITEEPCTVDMTGMPPALAEVYTAALLAALERKAARSRSGGGSEGGADNDAWLFYHRITLVVPPYDPQYVMWPSYVPKLSVQEEQEPEEAEPQTQKQRRERRRVTQSAESSPEAGSTSHMMSSQDDGSQGDSEQEEDQEEEVEVVEEAKAQDANMTRGRDGVNGSAAAGPLPVGHPATGLAVAATLRRMKFFIRGDAARGIITLEKADILDWVRSKRTYEARQSGALNPAGAPQGAAAMSFQQRNAQHMSDSLMHQRLARPYGTGHDAASEAGSATHQPMLARPGSPNGPPHMGVGGVGSMGGVGGMNGLVNQPMRLQLGFNLTDGAAMEPGHAGMAPHVPAVVRPSHADVQSHSM